MESVGYAFLDASALVKFFIKEDGSEKLIEFLNHESSYYTSPFCFYETLSAFKRKRNREEITQKQYEDASFELVAWFEYLSKQSGIKDIDFMDSEVFFMVRDLVQKYQKYKLDFSDAFQIVCVKRGYASHLVNGSQTIHVTADDLLWEVAKEEGIRSWNILKEEIPMRDKIS